MTVQFPCALTRENLIQVSVRTPHTVSYLEKQLLDAKENNRTILISPKGELYNLRPQTADLVMRIVTNG